MQEVWSVAILLSYIGIDRVHLYLKSMYSILRRYSMWNKTENNQTQTSALDFNVATFSKALQLFSLQLADSLMSWS